MDDKAVLAARVTLIQVGSRESAAARVMARAAAVGGRVPGFWLRYAVEQVYLVCFIRRRLVVHRFDREAQIA